MATRTIILTRNFKSGRSYLFSYSAILQRDLYCKITKWIKIFVQPILNIFLTTPLYSPATKLLSKKSAKSSIFFGTKVSGTHRRSAVTITSCHQIRHYTNDKTNIETNGKSSNKIIDGAKWLLAEGKRYWQGTKEIWRNYKEAKRIQQIGYNKVLTREQTLFVNKAVWDFKVILAEIYCTRLTDDPPAFNSLRTLTQFALINICIPTHSNIYCQKIPQPVPRSLLDQRAKSKAATNQC